MILKRLNALRHDELRDMLRQSYEMVAGNAPKSKTSREKKHLKKKASGKTTAKKRKKH